MYLTSNVFLPVNFSLENPKLRRLITQKIYKNSYCPNSIKYNIIIL